MSHEAVRRRLKGHQGKDRVSTRKMPSLSPIPGVNPSGNLSLRATGGKKDGDSPQSDDLIGELVQFLESKGAEVYRMQNGGYQVKGDREIVRFYITRRDDIKEERG